nr:hypothetical protein [Tanacetum cinerariifolium]
MRTRSSSNLVGEYSLNPTTSNSIRRNLRRSKQPFSLEESLVDTMADQRTMAELLRAPTEGYAEAIVVPPILAEHFELKHSLINMMTSDQFFRLDKDNPHDHIPDQDSLNSAAGDNLLERRTQDLLTIIKNKSKVRNSRNKSIVSQVKSSNVNSSSSPEIAKLTHAVNQQTSAGPLPSNTIANPKGELKAITTRSGLVLDGTSVPMPHPFINLEEDERAEETLTDPKLAEYTIKVLPPLVQKAKPHSIRNYVVHQRDPRYPHIPYPSRMNQEKQQEKDEIEIHKFWQMFKQLHINITLDDALILIPKYQKMLKALLSNKEKLLELVNTPLNENCSAVILKKLPEKLRDPGKFLILCGFSVLKCKALANLGASINLMPLSIWKKLGLPELISTRMTLELANRAICTPTGIARDAFVPVGKPFLRTARAMIDVYEEEMILCGGDERLTLNMRHGTSIYPNQPHKESFNMINIYNDSYEDYLEDFFATNHLSGNLTFSSHTDLTSPKVINPLSGNTTSSSPDHLLEEFADELSLITFPPENDDLLFYIESDLREIEYFLNHDPTKEMDSILDDSVDDCNLVDHNNDLADTILEIFIDEHTLIHLHHYMMMSMMILLNLSPIMMISSDFIPSPECYSVLYEDFFEVYALPSTNNEDKVFNPGILIHENLFEVTIRVTPDKNVKKISISNASLILEDLNPPLYELPFHKEVPGSKTLLSFSSKNKEKVFNLGILTSKGVHTSLLPELFHQGPKAFKVIKIFKIPMKIFLCSYGEDIRILDVPCLHFYPP